MSEQMIDAEVIPILAQRDGWTKIHATKCGCFWGIQSGAYEKIPKYHFSRDSLMPILNTLSDEEWLRLIVALCPNWKTNTSLVRFTLTIPASDLASALASVISGREYVAPPVDPTREHKLEEALRGLAAAVEHWNAAVEQIIDRKAQTGIETPLSAAKALLGKGGGE